MANPSVDARRVLIGLKLELRVLKDERKEEASGQR